MTQGQLATALVEALTRGPNPVIKPRSDGCRICGDAEVMYEGMCPSCAEMVEEMEGEG